MKIQASFENIWFSFYNFLLALASVHLWYFIANKMLMAINVIEIAIIKKSTSYLVFDKKLFVFVLYSLN